ncbi:cyclin-dependent kinase 1 [Tanacetum coccineum]
MVMRGAVIEKLFTSGAGWFEGSSSSSCSSPTSHLDSKLVMSPRRVLHNSSCDEIVSGRGIGLGIIVNMDKSCESKAILVRQSHHVNANIGDEDEEYTIVTRHHKPNNNNNSYTRKQLVYDNCGDHEKLIRSLFDISPTPARVDADIKAGAHDFLSTCHECNKQLHGKDIYMYRGEKAFCSIECRSMEIAQMEKEESMKKKMMMRNKHDCGSSTSYAPQQVPVSRSSGHDHGQMMLCCEKRIAATAGFLDSGGGGEKKKKKSGNVGVEQPAVRSNITSLQIEFTMDIFGTTGIQSSFTPMMTEVTRLGSKSIAHVLNSSTGGGFNVPTYSNTFLNSTSTLVNIGPDVVGSSSATGRSLGQIPEVNAISDICSNPNEEAPSSYANKLSHTFSTKANLCKLDANVPNDTDFDI